MAGKSLTTLKGKQIFYWDNETKDKEVVVILHGFPGNYNGLLDFAKTFKSQYRVIIPNLPSCGGTDPLEGKHNLKNYTKWLNEFLGLIGTKKVTLIGHSFGSRIAMRFAVDYPKKVDRLVLITPVLKADGMLPYVVLLKYEIAKLLPLPLRKPFIASKMYEYIACKIVLKSKNRGLHKKIIKRGIEELQNFNPNAHLELFDEFYHSDLTGLGSFIKERCLVVAGGKDIVATLRPIKQMVAGMNQATLSVMKGSGHLLPFEEVKEVAGIVQAWLKT